jgi:hypothetical protein
MTYHGRVRNSVVVFEQGPGPEEGTEVRVEPVIPVQGVTPPTPGPQSEAGRYAPPPPPPPPPAPAPAPALGQKLLKFAGRAKGLPPDAARNHDHYLYGVPKR